MKPIVLAIALTLAAPALAQPAKPAAPEAAKPPAQEAPKAAPQEKAKPTRVAKPNPRRGEDARHCLEKGSNLEIIKCAEAYL